MHMSSYIDHVPFSHGLVEKKRQRIFKLVHYFPRFYCYRNSECVSRTTLSNEYFLCIIQFPV